MTLLLLHGTGGDENDLLDVGRELSPEAALLSPRGKVLENGAPRFFRRLAEGVFDLDDLRFRTHELAAFVEASSKTYGFDKSRLVAVGFSNGANIASSLLLLHPEILAGAILFRPMVPFTPEKLPDLAGVGILVAGGLRDPLVPREQTTRLLEMFLQCHADAVLRWQEGGHSISESEVRFARGWLRSAPAFQRWHL
jgi:phospholipase/carboxylesterase